MNVYIILTILFFLLFMAGLWGVFEKAGEKGWKVLIPFYNLYVWLQIIRKPVWWYIFLLVPFINVFVVLLMVVEVLKCFGKHGLLAQALGVIFPFFYLPWLGFDPRQTYTDPKDAPVIRKSALREWVDAIIFAVIAASIIRIFLIEAYTIPTSSMEKTLLVGDYLFVSKVSYGPRVPNTPISFPFVHHTMPFTTTVKSYLDWIELPYYRFPGMNHVRNMDVVVFNYPDGDTLCDKWQSNVSYYQFVRKFGRDEVWKNKSYFGNVIARPVDKRENFIKRCIGTPGDTIMIADRHVFINGKEEQNPGKRQFKYFVSTTGEQINAKSLERLDITENILTDNRGNYEMTLSDEAVAALKSYSYVTNVEPIIQPVGQWDQDIFPFDSNYRWNVDNFGPLVVPKAGVTIPLSLANLPLYRRIIDVFEANDLEVKGDQVLINGKPATSYTFRMNYYFMMGDNRHNSADSRYWGFVPEDHVVGKAVFVWFSIDSNKPLFDGKIRFNHLFRTVK